MMRKETKPISRRKNMMSPNTECVFHDCEVYWTEWYATGIVHDVADVQVFPFLRGVLKLIRGATVRVTDTKAIFDVPGRTKPMIVSMNKRGFMFAPEAKNLNKI